MISTILIEHGETTCASEPGVFCRFAGATRFGTTPVCMLFGDVLLHSETPTGWIERCPACIKEFGCSNDQKVV